jgi:hypothetical protein
MSRTVMALYNQFEEADRVIEALLDCGFLHSDISFMSADHWFDLPDASSRIYKLQGDEVLLVVRASSDMAMEARDILCNSGPIDVHEQGDDRNEGWPAQPVTTAVGEVVGK